MNCNSSGTLQKHFQDETRNNYLKPIFLMRWPSWWKNFTLVYLSATLSSTLILYRMTPTECTAAVISIAVIDKRTHTSGCRWEGLSDAQGWKVLQACWVLLWISISIWRPGHNAVCRLTNTNFTAKQPTWYKEAHAGGWDRCCIAVGTKSTPPSCSFVYLHCFSPPCLANSECCVSPQAYYHFKYARRNLI